MKAFLLQSVIKPTIKAMAELCENNGITFICYIQIKEELTDEIITETLADNADDLAKKISETVKGK